MWAALTFVHAAAIRLSTPVLWLDPLPYQRSCVFRPSLSRMTTCCVFAGSAGGLKGTPWVCICQPQARPIVWLVEPLATMASTSLLNAVQLYPRARTAALAQDGELSATSIVLGVLADGTVFMVS